MANHSEQRSAKNRLPPIQERKKKKKPRKGIDEEGCSYKFLTSRKLLGSILVTYLVVQFTTVWHLENHPSNESLPQYQAEERFLQSSFHNTTLSSSSPLSMTALESHTVQNRILYEYYQDNLNELLDPFPDWIQNYLKWHSEQRKKFPGMQLFTNPGAPKLLVRVCLGVCGGLHDRLGQLPWDLYLANQTQRVLLIAWMRPRALQLFLVPAFPDFFDWRVPRKAKFNFADLVYVRDDITELFKDMPEASPMIPFWLNDVDAAIQRATVGEFKDVRILRHRILGHLGERELEARLKKAGETNVQLHTTPLFGNLFWLFFRPSKPVHDSFVSVLQNELHIKPQQYTTVHCRVRHPKAVKEIVKGKNPLYPADKTGLPWVGENRQFAIETATHALLCARYVLHQPSSGAIQPPNIAAAASQPIYFMSDSNDLVRHMAFELYDPQFLQINASLVDPTAFQVVQQGSAVSRSEQHIVVARDPSMENAHIDRQKGRPFSAYYATFVDLLLAIHAECVVYGIGYYARFAAKISGTTCKMEYTKQAWGDHSKEKVRELRRRRRESNFTIDIDPSIVEIPATDENSATICKPEMYRAFLNAATST